jgi:hypothetical protein
MMEAQSAESTRPTGPTKQEMTQIQKLEERAMKAKGAERQRLQEEANALMNSDSAAAKKKRDEAEEALTAQYAQAMSKFGGVSMVPAVAALLDSGRLLAVRSADA